MANITICTPIRDAGKHVQRYLQQCTALDELLYARGDKLSFVWAEGDSVDNTRMVLDGARFRFNATIVDCAHGGPKYASIVNADRFRQLAYVCNLMMAAVSVSADVVVILDSEYIWQAETLIALIDDVTDDQCMAPMVMHHRTGLFYDTWAFRRNGVNFTQRPPFHVDLGDEILQVDSAGSCLAMPGHLARSVNFPSENVIVGLCRQIYEQGGSVWVNPALSISHP